MNETSSDAAPTNIAKGDAASPEAVGLFADRDSFEAAIKALVGAGFERADLSVLSSHQSIDAAGQPGQPWRDVLTALVGELKFEAPLVASGAILLIGGPIAEVAAGLIGAAIGGIAAKEVIEGITSTPDTEDFARSLEAGSVILWVRAGDTAKQVRAMTILRQNGGRNVHLHHHARK